MRRAERSFPWAPRPFDDEALGGWIGRLAGAYRMTVDELADYAGLSVDMSIPNWLAIALQGEDRRRLAALCRLSDEELPRGHDREKPAHLEYCYRCLILNPVDVTAPYWRASWLEGFEREWCQSRCPLIQRTSLAVLRGNRNMAALVQLICQRRNSRELQMAERRRQGR